MTEALPTLFIKASIYRISRNLIDHRNRGPWPAIVRTHISIRDLPFAQTKEVCQWQDLQFE